MFEITNEITVKKCPFWELKIDEPVIFLIVYYSGAHSLKVLSYEHEAIYLVSGEISMPITFP